MTPTPAAPTTDRWIAAASKRQAMDWGLVLASQGIEATIERLRPLPPASSPPGAETAPPSIPTPSHAAGWGLYVAVSAYAHALDCIHRYEAENAPSGWRQELPLTGMLFHWGSLGWVALMMAMHGLPDAVWENLREAGLMDNTAVFLGQWWRVFTAVSLHADAGHLASNATTGTLLLGLAMARYGAGTALFASFLAGAGGNVVALSTYALSHRSLGASGMVMGALGLLAVNTLQDWRHLRPALKWARPGFLAAVLLLLLWGVSPHSDVVAHVGGFATGCFLGTGLALLPERWRHRPGFDVACMISATALFALSWWLALMPGH